MSIAVLEMELNDLPVRRGKVRDIFDLGDTRPDRPRHLSTSSLYVTG